MSNLNHKRVQFLATYHILKFHFAIKPIMYFTVTLIMWNVCHMKTCESLWWVALHLMKSDEAGLGHSALDSFSLGLLNLSSVSCPLGFYLGIIHVFHLYFCEPEWLINLWLWVVWDLGHKRTIKFAFESSKSA